MQAWVGQSSHVYTAEFADPKFPYRMCILLLSAARMWLDVVIIMHWVSHSHSTLQWVSEWAKSAVLAERESRQISSINQSVEKSRHWQCPACYRLHATWGCLWTTASLNLLHWLLWVRIMRIMQFVGWQQLKSNTPSYRKGVRLRSTDRPSSGTVKSLLFRCHWSFILPSQTNFIIV